MMAVRKIIIREGITEEVETRIGAPHTKAELRATLRGIRTAFQKEARLMTFDGRVADLERVCRRVRGRKRDDPPFGSRAWYARRILQATRAVREALARGDVQLALSDAVEVGDLATEAKAKFGSWKKILLDEASTAKSRELAKRAVEERRKRAQEDLSDDDIDRDARRHFAAHPTHSMRRMAAAIAGPLDAKKNTILSRLHRRGVRKPDLVRP